MKLAFWMLALIILCNLNGAAYMGFGTTRMFTPIIAICCLILIQACLHSVSAKKALGFSGFLIVSALVSYLYIGCFIAFVNASWESYYYGILIGHLFTIIVIIAAAIGGRAVIRQTGPEPVLKAILVLLTLDCIIILASPILSDVYREKNMPGSYTYRSFGTFLDPNGAGLIACATAVLALSFFSLKQHRKFAYLALILGTAAILGTASRAAMLSFVCYFFLFFLFNSGVRRFVLKGSIFMILSGIIVFDLLFLKTAEYLSRISVILFFHRHNFLKIERRYGSSDRRIPIWYLALDQIFESPISTIFGLGLGKMYRVENAPIDDIVRGQPFGVHNNYLLFFGESGLIPLTLFLLFFVYLFFLKISNPVVRNAIFGWVLTIAVFCLTQHTIILKRTVAFIIGLSCALVGFGNHAGTKQDGVK